MAHMEEDNNENLFDKLHLSNYLQEFEEFEQFLSNDLYSSFSFEENEESKANEIERFPNEVYANFMKLIIKNNLNNTVGNDIIKFFNEYSNLSVSPLPKSIEAGRKFMDKMRCSHLSNRKYKIITHNNKKYFIHYRSILECIQNLLSNQEIAEVFKYNYENLKVNLVTF